MLLRDRTLPPEPRAEKHPVRSTHHGETLVDEFAWLRAANWQEVMRDPARLDPAIRAYLEAENAYAERALADTATLQAALFARDEGPHQGRRLERADARRPVCLLCALPRVGGQHPAHVPAAARRRARGNPARWRCARGRQGVLSSSAEPATRPTIACSPGRPTRPAPSSTRCACAISPPGTTLPTLFRTWPERRYGPPIPPPSTTSGSTATIGPRGSFAIASARPPRTMCSSSRSSTRVISCRSRACSRAALRKSRFMITRPRSPVSSI